MHRTLDLGRRRFIVGRIVTPEAAREGWHRISTTGAGATITLYRLVSRLGIIVITRD